jgi:hypothetical protein
MLELTSSQPWFAWSATGEGRWAETLSFDCAVGASDVESALIQHFSGGKLGLSLERLNEDTVSNFKTPEWRLSQRTEWQATLDENWYGKTRRGEIGNGEAGDTFAANILLSDYEFDAVRSATLEMLKFSSGGRASFLIWFSEPGEMLRKSKIGKSGVQAPSIAEVLGGEPVAAELVTFVVEPGIRSVAHSQRAIDNV